MDKTSMAIAVFDKHAQKYQDKFMDVRVYHDTFDLFCHSIEKENAEILELACGPGNVTQYLLKQRPDYKILGIDLSPNMLTLAKINNPEAEFKLMDCRDIGKLNKKYDALIGGFCLPYLSKEEAFTLIRDAAKLLHEKGVLYLSTMEDNYSQSGFQTSTAGDTLYMYYHQADYLRQALEENNFKILDLQQLSYLANDETPTTDLILIGRK